MWIHLGFRFGLNRVVGWGGLALVVIIVPHLPARANTPTVLVADSDPIACRTLTVTTYVTGSGMVTQTPVNVADPCGGAYEDGTVIQLLATPDVDCSFVNWIGPDANQLSATDISNPTIVMNGDYEVAAVFDFTLICYSLTLNVTGDGTAQALTPTNCDGGYPEGAIVTLLATPAHSFTFLNWTGATVADPNCATTTITMNYDSTVTANFEMIYADCWPIVTLPTDPPSGPEVWLIGGVCRTIRGCYVNFHESQPIHFTVTHYPAITAVAYGFNARSGGTLIDVVLPPLDDGTTQQSFDVNVSLDGNVGWNNPQITYRRFATYAGVNTTAFIMDSAYPNMVRAWDGTSRDNIALLIPALEESGRTLYGILRSVQLTDVISPMEDMPATVSRRALAFGTGAIADVGVTIDDEVTSQNASGNVMLNATEFALYLYENPLEVKQNTQPGEPTYVEATVQDGSGSPLFDIPAPIDEHGNIILNENGYPVSTPALLSFPVHGAFTAADVANGIGVWGVRNSFNYVTMQVTGADPPEIAYQSMFLTPAEVDAGATQVTEARLYSLNGFSLRTGGILPNAVIDQMRLDTENGAAQGPITGSTTVKIVSPGGGLGYVDRIRFVGVANPFEAVATTSAFITPPGTNEYLLSFLTPECDLPGMADIEVYLKSAPNTLAARLPHAFLYTAPLSGRLTGWTGNGIAGVEVRVYDEDGQELGSAVTGPDGTYVVDSMDTSGTLRLSFTHPDFGTVWRTVLPGERADVPVKVKPFLGCNCGCTGQKGWKDCLGDWLVLGLSLLLLASWGRVMRRSR